MKKVDFWADDSGMCFDSFIAFAHLQFSRTVAHIFTVFQTFHDVIDSNKVPGDVCADVTSS